MYEIFIFVSDFYLCMRFHICIRLLSMYETFIFVSDFYVCIRLTYLYVDVLMCSNSVKMLTVYVYI